MSSQLKCILFWLLLIIMMILHFNYHVGELFYGIDVQRENANGTVPIATHLIRNIFYHLPVIWILILIYSEAKYVKKSLFIISIIYTFAHASHLVGEFKSPDLSQIPLLVLALIFSVLLNMEHYKYLKECEIK